MGAATIAVNSMSSEDNYECCREYFKEDAEAFVQRHDSHEDEAYEEKARQEKAHLDALIATPHFDDGTLFIRTPASKIGVCLPRHAPIYSLDDIGKDRSIEEKKSDGSDIIGFDTSTPVDDSNTDDRTDDSDLFDEYFPEN